LFGSHRRADRAGFGRNDPKKTIPGTILRSGTVSFESSFTRAGSRPKNFFKKCSFPSTISGLIDYQG
ncbi:MAG TPA: hypothetical protein VMU54_02725, partial [Planctomycetota bacterium]|nr:hypothetical protein [Planctomycetota bacterium]